MVYKVSAIAASLGVTSLAVTAVYLRFHWHMQSGGEFPWAEAAATLALTIGGAVRSLHQPVVSEVGMSSQLSSRMHAQCLHANQACMQIRSNRRLPAAGAAH